MKDSVKYSGVGSGVGVGVGVGVALGSALCSTGGVTSSGTFTVGLYSGCDTLASSVNQKTTSNIVSNPTFTKIFCSRRY